MFHVNVSLTAVSLIKLYYSRLRSTHLLFSMSNVVRRAFNTYFLQQLLAHWPDKRHWAEKGLVYETSGHYSLIQAIAA